MKIDVITIFPDMFAGQLDHSILKRAQQSGLVNISIHNLRQWTTDLHKTTDDRPYGGGPGMVMMVEPIDKAVNTLKDKSLKSRVILLSASGTPYTQQKAQTLTQYDQLILICGHYEGVDGRVEEHIADESISIGNYVLTGGEIPAMIIADSVTRLLPNVLGESTSLHEESHTYPGYLEYPQYTRPENYKGWQVPRVLLSGHHQHIKQWQHQASTHPDSKSS